MLKPVTCKLPSCLRLLTLHSHAKQVHADKISSLSISTDPLKSNSVNLYCASDRCSVPSRKENYPSFKVLWHGFYGSIKLLAYSFLEIPSSKKKLTAHVFFVVQPAFLPDSKQSKLRPVVYVLITYSEHPQFFHMAAQA